MSPRDVPVLGGTRAERGRWARPGPDFERLTDEKLLRSPTPVGSASGIGLVHSTFMGVGRPIDGRGTYRGDLGT